MTDAQASPGASALRVALTLAGIVLAAVVFFGLGVMEGSRVADVVPVVAAPPSALPTETLKTQPAEPVAAVAPISTDKLTFYDRLSGAAPPAPVALPESPAPVPAAPPAARETPARQPGARPPPVTAAANPGSVAPPAAAKSAVPPKSGPAEQIRRLSGKGRFTVQMAAVSERAAAEKTAAMIKSSGFEAVTVMASVKGKIWYRIRVGSYPTKQAAAQAAGIFRSAYGLNAVPVEN